MPGSTRTRATAAKTPPKAADTDTVTPADTETVTPADTSAQDDTTAPTDIDESAAAETSDAPDWDALLAAVEFEEPRTRDTETRAHIVVDPRIQAMVEKSRDTGKKGVIPCTNVDLFHTWKRQMQAAADRLTPAKSVNVRMIEKDGVLVALQFRVTERRGSAKKPDRKSDAIDTQKDAAPTRTE